MAERPEDLNLPNAVVSRIIKEALPPSVKVSKEAQAAVAKAASVFVLYATSCANNVALKSHRKTIHGGDVVKAMEDMEFDKFIKPLENSLESKCQVLTFFRIRVCTYINFGFIIYICTYWKSTHLCIVLRPVAGGQHVQGRI